ncbi:MAG: hypothetical protein M0R00_06400 [Candidatus Omnitrophica bacterium]|jgi:hypothetical protein|nr:hypothetical protein [Candidatus Omnitrophota bacterium]
MSWNLEQSIDAAFVSYLKPLLPGTMKVYPSCTNEELQFPCAVCHAGEGTNENDDIGFNGHRRITVHCVVMIEAADELDAAGVKIKSSLQRISEARGEVMGALAKKYLEQDLNDTNSPGVKFSLAQVTTTSDPVTEGRLFIATINVEVIANPVQI